MGFRVLCKKRGSKVYIVLIAAPFLLFIGCADSNPTQTVLTVTSSFTEVHKVQKDCKNDEWAQKFTQNFSQTGRASFNLNNRKSPTGCACLKDRLLIDKACIIFKGASFFVVKIHLHL